MGYFLAKWWGSMDNEVTVYFRLNKDTKKKYAEYCNEYYEIENVVFKPIFIDYDIYSFILFPLILYNILKISLDIMKKNYDVIHYNSVPIDIAILLPLISHFKNSYQTMTIHGAIFADKKYHFFKKIIMLQKSFFNRIIVLNDYSKKLAIEAGFNECQLNEISNGIEMEFIEKAQKKSLQGSPVILFVGVLTKNKAVDVVIKAVFEIVKSYNKVMLYIVGDGPEKKILNRLILNMNLQDHITFTGFIPTSDVFSYYKSADVLVLSSYEENFSITILEAMASKTLVVVSDAPGNLSIVKSEKNGFVFPRGDYRTLASLIIKNLSDKKNLNTIIENAYNEIKESYTWKVIAHKYEKVFKELIINEEKRTYV